MFPVQEFAERGRQTPQYMDLRIAGARRMPDNLRPAPRAQDAKQGFQFQQSDFPGRLPSWIRTPRITATGSRTSASSPAPASTPPTGACPASSTPHFVRADRAHAEIVSVKTGKAAKHPGVKRVYTGEDALAAGYTKYFVIVNFPGRGGNHIIKPPRPVLAARQGAPRRRRGGDGGRRYARPRRRTPPSWSRSSTAICRRWFPPRRRWRAGAPQLHEEAPGNLAFDYETGNEEAVKAAFAQAAHVTRLKLEVTRVAPNPMELRGCTVRYDAEGRHLSPVRLHPGHQHDAQAARRHHRRAGGQDRTCTRRTSAAASGREAPSIPSTACRCWRRRSSAARCGGSPRARKAS